MLCIAQDCKGLSGKEKLCAQGGLITRNKVKKSACFLWVTDLLWPLDPGVGSCFLEVGKCCI